MATLVVMPLLIPFLHKIKFGQSIRKEGPQSHMAKTGTPDHGRTRFCERADPRHAGIGLQGVFLGGNADLCARVSGYALIGFIDDFLIVVKKNNDGLKPSMKFLMQSILAVVFICLPLHCGNDTDPSGRSHLAGAGYSIFRIDFFMFTCESNAVNLTDGLDGLCAGPPLLPLHRL